MGCLESKESTEVPDEKTSLLSGNQSTPVQSIPNDVTVIEPHSMETAEVRGRTRDHQPTQEWPSSNQPPNILSEEQTEITNRGRRKSVDIENEEAEGSVDVDISVIPQTTPSLGIMHGHEKKDVVKRSSSKRRPASKRKTLLLDSKEEVLMGKERVDLSAVFQQE